MHDIDPGWAWSPVEESQQPWTRQLAAHLYRRAGFSATSETLDEAANKSAAEVVAELVDGRTESEEYLAQMKQLGRTVVATGNVENLPAWWMYRFLTTTDMLREKMTLFWHGHFATSGDKVTDPQLMVDQNELLRRNSLGNFGTLVAEISRNPAMLIYLDSVTNRKAHPNENFAREVMELFALGEGRYTEDDIRELSRCFTGWEIRNGRYRFNRYQHDSGRKSILGQEGPFDGDEGVAIVLDQPALPDFIIGKLYQFFIADEPAPPAELLAPLTIEFRENGLNIAPVLKRILSSQLFYSPHSVARKVRSPVEFSVGFLRALEGSTDQYALTSGLSELGQVPFFPPNVKGWDGGRTWINSSTLLARSNLIQSILKNKNTRFSNGTLSDLFDKHRLNSSQEIIDWLETMLLAVSLPETVRLQLQSKIDSGSGNREERLKEVVHLICGLPEYQLS
ncbi:hypothetical protein KOR42_24900 [Thalassoglobus neptunius]|uniref:DUF1800 domain-containing protein n=1 Tax=Thalassoglobus neptunius TaxID=1938619 RepID=A0A5C5X9N2_9PLAN|nr:DUF1800 domain-containing protein [Thalassoglobus neptunius]TWT59101.1 hypothetical protein KOR42_24900 [Thalassoglobus neptunius]